MRSGCGHQGQPWSRALIASLALAAAIAGGIAAGCASQAPTAPTSGSPPAVPPVTPPQPPPVPGVPQTFVGAGDIAMCDGNAEATARLLDGIGGTVFALGDNAYFSGTRDEFARCYEPTWGRHKLRTRPVPGNHDYGSPGAQPYYDYFGPNAGPAGLGYYSFELGDWHAVALNSNVPADDGSAQMAWLQADLLASRARCTVAYWHHPLFTSGPNGPQTYMRAIWRALHRAGVDLVLNGHDHLYERFAPQDPDGSPDPARGIRQFTVGTGGAFIYKPVRREANSEVVLESFGVLRLTLESDRYSWEFIPTAGAGDSGTASCH